MHEGLWRLHVCPGLGHLELVDMDPARVRTWRQGLVDVGVGPVTVAKAYRLLKAVLNTAVDDELIRRNPCRIKGAGQERSPERPVVTVREVFAIADAIRPWFRALVLLAAFCGLRWGELVALRRRNVDLKEGIVGVQVAMVEVHGVLIEGSPKSLAGRRDVAIPAAIIPDLRSHLEEWSQAGPDGRVFVGPKGAMPRRANFQVVWQDAIRESGVSPLHFHDLRHAGNVLASRAGSLKEVMARMGHSTTRAALIYQHATTDRERALGAAVSRMIEDARWRSDGHATGTGPDLEDDGGAADVPSQV